MMLLPEAHPDVIGSNGVATPEGYQSDLAYLKKKVTLILIPFPLFLHGLLLCANFVFCLLPSCFFFLVVFSLMLGLI